MRLRLNSTKGFTLVELLIGVALLGILMAAVFGVLSSSLSSFQYNFTQNRNVEDVRQAINTIADELRYAICVGGVDTATQCAGVTTTTIPSMPTLLSLTDGNSLVYVVVVNNVPVTRTLTRTVTGANSKTFVLQGGTAVAYPTYRFGNGIVTALSFTREDYTSEHKMRIRVSITMNDTSYAGGQPFTSTIDVIPQNIQLP